ncbi:MAG: YtxH domain-containing protein [Chloroflexota bacterium]
MDSTRTYYSREAEEKAARDRAASTIIYLLLGVGIGTVLALMLAPNSGEKTRKNLVHSVEGSLNNGRDTVEPTLKRLEKEFADLRKKVDDRIGELR